MVQEKNKFMRQVIFFLKKIALPLQFLHIYILWTSLKTQQIIAIRFGSTGDISAVLVINDVKISLYNMFITAPIWQIYTWYKSD